MRRMVKVAEEKVSSRGAIVGSVIPQSNYNLIWFEDEEVIDDKDKDDGFTILSLGLFYIFPISQFYSILLPPFDSTLSMIFPFLS